MASENLFHQYTVRYDVFRYELYINVGCIVSRRRISYESDQNKRTAIACPPYIRTPRFVIRM